MTEYTIVTAFLVGMASFLSPCILPVVPGFISSLAGTIDPKEIDKSKRAIFLSTLYFVLGFALVFALVGTLISCLCTAQSALGVQIKHWISYLGGFVIVGFGIFLILTAWIPRLNFQTQTQERIRGKITRAHASYVSSWVIGATFAAGWTPCVGPLLGSVLALAATQPAAAYNSLLAYSLGLGIPFILIACFFTQLTPVLRKISKYTKHFDLVMGGILIAVGIIFLLNQFL